MSQSIITNAFEQLKAQQAANGSIIVLDKFVFANIPDLDVNLPISRDESWPAAEYIVHRQDVGKTGMVNANAVAYSAVLGADVGDFEFNWIGLVSSASDTVCMIVHAPLQKKIKTAAGQQGNVLTRSFLMEYSGASEQTAINTPVDTWQIDFTARLNGVDERIRRENIDIYGDASFLDDGFKVSLSGTKYIINRGTGYVAGLKATLMATQELSVTDKPVKVWVDVCWRGTLTSNWDSASKIVIAESLENYADNDELHYVSAVAEILSDGSVVDTRPISSHGALSQISAEKNTAIYFDENKKARLTDLSELVRGMLGKKTEEEILGHLGLQDEDATGISDAKVSVRQKKDGAFLRTQEDINADNITLADAGAKGDGVSDDTAAFQLFESWFNNHDINLLGKTFYVASVPSGNRYTNGYFIVNGVTYPAWYQPVRQWGKIILAGDNALAKYRQVHKSSQALIVLGADAAKSAAPDAQGGIVLGDGAHEFSPFIPYQTIAIGKRSFARVTPDSSSLTSENGNRNVGIGAYTGLFTTIGYQNVFLGRNSGSNVTTGFQNTALGTGAMKGSAPVGLDGEVVCENALTGDGNTAVGYNAIMHTQGRRNTALGERAGVNLKLGDGNILIGSLSGYAMGSLSAFNNYLLSKSVAQSGSYVQSGATITLTTPAAHGAVVGGYVQVQFLNGGVFEYTADAVTLKVITVPSSTVMTVASPVMLNASGACTVLFTTTTGMDGVNGLNTVVGYSAASNMTSALGITALGYNAGINLLKSNYGTFIGRYAGSTQFNGVANTEFGDNVTAIGNYALLTANNQVQLGNSDTTVYYYQMAQRSDIRDKQEIRETVLGLDFINKMRFVDYKWNYREDYLHHSEDANGKVVTTVLDNDGSKTRKRWHHGVIAQETESVLKGLDIDSGIFQDHMKCGGADVKTVSYNELIGPMGKAIQELSAELEIVRKELAELKGG